MKTIKIVTALLFAVLLSTLFAIGTGIPVPYVAAFVIPLFILASKYAPKGVLGLDLMSIDDQVVDNMAGIQAKVYIALADDIATWPTIPTLNTGMDVIQVLTGSLVMKTGKYFFPFEIEPDKCSVECSDVGVKGGICQKYTVKLYRADLSPRMRGFVRATNNQKLALIVPDNQGRYNFIGSAAIPARKVPEGNAGTGEGPEGESATTFTFVSYGNGAVPILASNTVIPLPEDS